MVKRQPSLIDIFCSVTIQEWSLTKSGLPMWHFMLHWDFSNYCHSAGWGWTRGTSPRLISPPDDSSLLNENQQRQTNYWSQAIGWISYADTHRHTPTCLTWSWKHIIRRLLTVCLCPPALAVSHQIGTNEPENNEWSICSSDDQELPVELHFVVLRAVKLSRSYYVPSPSVLTLWLWSWLCS